jgi:hypothetical protein
MLDKAKELFDIKKITVKTRSWNINFILI